MPQIQVAFQGEPGAYSELAAIEYFGKDILTLPCYSFNDVYEAVNQQKCQLGIIPIENSLAGSIYQNYDLMLHYDLHIYGEYHLRVKHCLLGLPGSRVDQIQRVYSHPQALAQCHANLVKMGVECINQADTAGSARQLHETGDLHAAAIASSRAAEVYHLEILSTDLEDNPANYTRFLVLGTQPWKADDPNTGDYKTSIVFSLKNVPGSLFKAMSVFALRDIDLTKIESRPLIGQPWEYLFYIDFAGHADSRNCRRALDHLNELATYFRLLGSYPRHRWDH